MATSSDQKNHVMRKLARSSRSITFCLIVLALVAIPGFTLPQQVFSNVHSSPHLKSPQADKKQARGEMPKVPKNSVTRPQPTYRAKGWSQGVGDTMALRLIVSPLETTGAVKPGNMYAARKSRLVDDPPTPAPCSKGDFVAVPSPPTFSNEPHEGSFPVAVNSGVTCRWTAEPIYEDPDDKWFTVTRDQGFTGNPLSPTVTYTMARNNGPERVGTIHVLNANNDLVIEYKFTQEAADCTYALEALDPLIPAEVSQTPGSFTVTTNLNTCGPWTATPNVNWIHIAEPTHTGSRQGVKVNFTWDANMTHSPRPFKIIITGPGLPVNGKSIDFTQAQAVCTYTLTTENALIPKDPGPTPGSFTVRTNFDDCGPWTATSNVPWIQIPQPSNTGSTLGVKSSFTWTANLGRERPGKITITGPDLPLPGKFVDITQECSSCDIKPPSNCTFAITSTNTSILSPAGEGSFNVTTNLDTCEWAAISDASWIHIAEPSQTGTKTGVKFSWDSNSSPDSRSAKILLKGQDKSITITQAGCPDCTSNPQDCTYAISTVNNSIPSEMSTTPGSFIVKTNLDTCGPWTATTDADWIEISEPTHTGSIAGITVNFTWKAYLGKEPRLGKITITGPDLPLPGKSIIITQNPACTFTLIPAEAFLGELKASYSFIVSTTPECRWEATPSDSTWISIQEPKTQSETKLVVTGKGTLPVVFTVEKNDKQALRPGGIAINPPGVSGNNKVFNITQGVPGKEALGGCPESPNTTPTTQVSLGKTIYGRLSPDDCPSMVRASGFRADRYELTITDAQGEKFIGSKRIAINVSSSDFDPFIILQKKTPQNVETVGNDDGAGYSNARMPRLPGKDAFMDREFDKETTYIIEVSSFKTSGSGNYAIVVIADDQPEKPKKPVILGAVTDQKTLIVTGENFADGAELLIGDSEEPEKRTKNDKSRSRTALIALKSASKVKKGCVKLRVKNTYPDGSVIVSDVFVYKPCS